MFNEHEHDQSDQVQEMKRTQHKHLLRLFPLLDRINLESVDEILGDDVVASRRRQTPLAPVGGIRRISRTPHGPTSESNVFLNALGLCAQFRNYINKLLSSKIRVSFHSTTEAMKYQKLILSYQMYRSLFS